ncbi:MAG TPA: type II toxin-antitoxin system HicB family antitoxin [Alphaproteobacteria bacterium]|nr:type II toxin-antitoxin system HicB family antitoxin [Alphaproteobacteria bacterium]
MTDYLALLRAANGSGYSVRFPDFPDISAIGDTMDEARDAARETLAAQIGFMLDEGLAIPEPSPLEVIMADRRNRDAVALLLSAPPIGKPVRIAANVDERLVREIDALAVGQGIGRGDVIVEALRQYVATARQASKITAEVKAMKRSGRRR